MHKNRLVIFVLVLLLLTGCGKKKEPTQKALDFRTNLLQTEGCSFTAKIHADYGEKFYDFTLEAVCSSEETKLTVIEPAVIEGISATVTKDGTKIEFDGAALDFGKLANGHVSPVLVPWLLAQCWTAEYISCAGADKDLYRVTYLRGYDDAQLSVDTWFNEESIPVYAEIVYNDVRCITADIEDFQT